MPTNCSRLDAGWVSGPAVDGPSPSCDGRPFCLLTRRPPPSSPTWGGDTAATLSFGPGRGQAAPRPRFSSESVPNEHRDHARLRPVGPVFMSGARSITDTLIQSEAAQHLSSAVGGHTPFRSGLTCGNADGLVCPHHSDPCLSSWQGSGVL